MKETIHSLLHRRTSRAAVVLAGLLAVSLVSLRANPPSGREPTRVEFEGREILSVGFDTLAGYDYEIFDIASGATEEEIAAAKERDQIPDWVRVYADQRVMLTGYMLPLKMEGGRATSFIMMRDVTTCCYGNVPNMNEYVIVSMTTGGVEAVQDIPVLLVGTLKINEVYENGYLTSLYQMDGEKFLGPKE